VIDLVLRVQTVGRDRDQWLIQTGSARELVPPLTDEHLRQAAIAATPLGRASLLPAGADTWDGLLAHLRPNDVWLPGARILELVGRLIHDHLIRGRVADYVHRIETRARAERVTLRYVVHVFEGEEDGLLPRLPFELMHRGAFWFRRAGTVGVRLPPDTAPRDVHLPPGAKVLVAGSHTEGRAPSAAELTEHVDHIADALRRAGFVAHTLPGCTPTILEAALRDGCDLLYLVCHGDEDLDRTAGWPYAAATSPDASSANGWRLLPKPASGCRPRSCAPAGRRYPAIDRAPWGWRRTWLPASNARWPRSASARP
jgi:hypothetical protein